MTMTIPTDGRIDLDALAACPFCGWKPDWHDDTASLDIYCPNEQCGCARLLVDGGGDYRERAIAAWNRRAAIPSEQGEAVAWVFELAKARERQTGEWTHFGLPQLSFDKPNVPDGAIRNLHALYAHPAPAAGVKVKAREAAEAEIARWGDDADPASVARSAVEAALKALDQGEPK